MDAALQSNLRFFFTLEFRLPAASLLPTIGPAIRYMNAEATSDANLPSAAEPRSFSATRIVRRVHLYLGLFLAPWMLMYALSTMVMNHREFVSSFHATKTPGLTTERELDYARTFPTGTTPQEMSRQILSDLGLAGAHRVSGGKDGKPLVIDRQHPLAQRRITLDPKAAKLTVQREEFRGATFLERMHRRRGYQHPYALEDTWAFSVDLTVLTIIFWALSGIWIWWELRAPRVWGFVAGGLGLVLFTIFLALL